MKIFSADGGGYLGLATASFIAESERHFDKRFADVFDLFCGTSTGAIIALALAHGLDGSQIVGLYETLGTNVFRNRFKIVRAGRRIKAVVRSMYSNKALRAALDTAFGDATLGDLHANGRRVIITSFSLTRGKPRVFKTDHGPDLTTDNGYKLKDVALASAAAPIYFPVVKLNCPIKGTSETFCDGGLFANHPALLGLAECVSHLGEPLSNISVLSLSTPRSDIAQPESGLNFLDRMVVSRGLISWGTKIFNVMIDGTSEASHETLRRLVDWGQEHSRYQRIDFPKPRGLDMDIADKQATETLKQLGFQRAVDGATRQSISQFFE